MKKAILVAGLFVVGFANANNLEVKISKSNVKTTVLKTKQQKKKVKELGSYTYHSTCGVDVVTYQAENWGTQNQINWIKAIEANYCAEGAPYSNTSGL